MKPSERSSRNNLSHGPPMLGSRRPDIPTGRRNLPIGSFNNLTTFH